MVVVSSIPVPGLGLVDRRRPFCSRKINSEAAAFDVDADVDVDVDEWWDTALAAHVMPLNLWHIHTSHNKQERRTRWHVRFR